MLLLLAACVTTTPGRSTDTPDPSFDDGSFTSGAEERPAGRVWLVPWPPAAEALASAASAALAGPSESQTGRTVQAVDLDQDGVDELLVGSPDEAIGRNRGGRSRVVRGPGQLTGGVELASLGAVIQGAAGSWMHGVAGVGDQTGDGLPDLVLASHVESQGTVHLLDGTLAIDGAALGPDDAFAAVADPEDGLGRGLASLGDLDGDGREDLLLGQDHYDYGNGWSRGRVVVWRSSSWVPGSTVPVGSSPAVEGDRRGHELGERLPRLPVGDLGGDGLPELVLGQLEFGEDDLAHRGIVAVFDGTSLTDGSTREIQQAPSRIEGDHAYQEVGAEVTGVGDLDGDGVSEIAVLARVVTGPAEEIETVEPVLHLFYGADLATPGVRGQDDAWVTVGGVRGIFPSPDLDGDGVAELIVLRDGIEVLSGGALPADTVLATLSTDDLDLTTARVAVLRTGSGFLLAVGFPNDDLEVPAPSP